LHLSRLGKEERGDFIYFIFLLLMYLWNWGLSLELHILADTLPLEPHSSPFCSGYFGDGISQTICPGWHHTVILLISASQVATSTWLNSSKGEILNSCPKKTSY
jgi:hypothetical protein